MSTPTTTDVITRLYTCFAERDGAGMAACYAPDAHFSDPVFPSLNGWEVGAMWRMLCERGKDLAVTSSNIRADGARGFAHWEATYTFSATGRKVHNVIDAVFLVQGGLIHRHADVFSLWRWSRQALGAKGWLLGWTPIVANAVRAEADKGLRLYAKRKRLDQGTPLRKPPRARPPGDSDDDEWDDDEGEDV